MKKSYKNNPDNKSKKGQKFLAVFGTVILLVVLVTGFAILACYLFCVGSFAFALIAVFGGIGGSVVMAVAMFRSIHQKYKKTPKDDIKQDEAIRAKTK